MAVKKSNYRRVKRKGENLKREAKRYVSIED